LKLNTSPSGADGHGDGIDPYGADGADPSDGGVSNANAQRKSETLGS
jgi:hypothetical protein